MSLIYKQIPYLCKIQYLKYYMKTFEELGLVSSLLTAISELGYAYPMPIQEETIPYLLEADHDLIALAQTGTGKTAAFGLPLLQRLDPSDRSTQALIMCPTRELCLQIADDLQDYSKYMEAVHVLPVYGGSSIRNQIDGLKRGAQVIVATPGRLLDLINRGIADLSHVRNVVMDEADEMLNMGFTEDIDAILSQIPLNRSINLFSATMPEAIEAITGKYMHEPREIIIGKKNESTSAVRHVYYMVQAKDKYQTLKRIVDYYPRIYGIVFCRTKAETQEISDKLIRDGYNVDALHGDLSQAQRDYVMRRFRMHGIQLLIATDVAARGLDVDDLSHVINYTLPDDTEVYTHRSGRTGRAGKTGISIAIINMRETHKIKTIERNIGKTFEVGSIPTGKEICTKQIFSLMDRIEKVEVNEEEIADLLPAVFRKLEWLDKEELVKRVVSLEFNRMIEYYQENEDFETVSADRKTPRDRTEITIEPGYTKLFINLGKMDGVSPKNLLQLINDCVQGKVDIGRIDLFTRYSLFDVKSESSDEVMQELNTFRIRGRAVKVSEATEEQINRGKKEREGGSKEKRAPREGTERRESRGRSDRSGRRDRYGRDDRGERRGRDEREDRGGRRERKSYKSKGRR